jgi:bifunctional N-acetylglucosamine-1-phosphate-uridyltransferase/glucosamine-1-phosphate-acetyltransferase GlmU-like protein
MELTKRITLTERIGVILAGGLGKRMNSHLPKPAHKIGDCSMLQHEINKMDRINIDKIYFVFKTKQLEYAETIMHKFI